MSWYVAQTKPHSERLAIEHLGRQHFETFFPMFLLRTREGDKTSALFPSYVFVSFELEQQRWRKIHSTQGILRLLGSNPEAPARVREDAMQALLRTGGMIEDLRRVLPFEVGESVVFKAGPLKGHSGRVVESSQSRVALLYHLLGTERVVYSAPSMLRSAAYEPGTAVVR